MKLNDIYKPIEHDIPAVEKFIFSSLNRTNNESILEINKYLLESPGKRIRPALVMLSSKSVSGNGSGIQQALKIAAAVELIHMASLIHDDVMDHSQFRYNKPTINYRNGGDVAIALGDYLYATASELITDCGNLDVIRCISSATMRMCEGEFIQVCERENINLLKERYINIITKKTASLFAASCGSGALISNGDTFFKDALMGYGLNFGIAFQIIDDYMDLVSEKKKLGKTPGQDLKVGEMTLPILNMLESASETEKKKLIKIITSRGDHGCLAEIKQRLLDSSALQKTKESALYYISIAKTKIEKIADSPYKESLLKLTEFVMDRGFNGSSKH